MTKKVELKDYSFHEIENKPLYNDLKENSTLVLDTSVCDVMGANEESKPILEIRRSDKENKVEITTFGYVGRFTYNKVEFDITYRFGDKLLERMISLVNDFDLKTLEYEARNTKNSSDSLAMKILYLNFIFKLEKLSILGLPKSYERVEYHDNKLRGQIDINRFIKKDMPFTGRISSISHEQVYVQEIVDILFSTLQVVEKSMTTLVQSRLFQIRNLLYHHANRRFIDNISIEKALHHKSIQNSLYSEFKPLLEISSYIIRYENKLSYKSNNILNGLILDVSLLWESYLYKLLKNSFEKNGWEVLHEEKLSVYEDKFYERDMIPDIVMKKDNKVLVFDAKSKSMEFRGRYENGGDLDRNDFFQINTYMSYYQNQGYNVIAGGLLYPMKSPFEKAKCHADHWFGNEKTKFIVDGLELSDVKSMEDMEDMENNFICRIEELTGEC